MHAMARIDTDPLEAHRIEMSLDSEVAAGTPPAAGARTPQKISIVRKRFGFSRMSTSSRLRLSMAVWVLS